MNQLGTVMIGVSAFAFFAVIAGILFHRILGADIEGSISALHCIVVGGLFIGLMVSIIMTPKSPSYGLVAILILLVFVAIPIVTSLGEKKDTKDFYDERILKYQEAIDRDPRNLAAREKLVEAYHKLGRLQEAVAICEQLVLLDPHNKEMAYRLRLLREESEERISPRKTCPSCGHRNPPGRTHCEQCESLMSVGGEFRKWLAQGGLKRITWSFAVSMGVVALFGVIMAMLMVPGRIVFVALLLLVVITAQYIYIMRQW
jgi:ribosomal protein L40E